ncbi:hypothetical protein NTCA1_45710 [Novosphingobium sp. TCA1]|nr:hypothetical protein NTCA1_45710 [Novosphingobium sp. TCA1]
MEAGLAIGGDRPARQWRGQTKIDRLAPSVAHGRSPSPFNLVFAIGATEPNRSNDGFFFLAHKKPS